MTDKMTPEQAIIRIELFKNENPIVETRTTLKTALDMAIEALEKQIPKEPILNIIAGHCEFICPSCEANHVNNKMHCDKCGQAIDWESDTE